MGLIGKGGIRQDLTDVDQGSNRDDSAWLGIVGNKSKSSER